MVPFFVTAIEVDADGVCVVVFVDNMYYAFNTVVIKTIRAAFGESRTGTTW